MIRYIRDDEGRLEEFKASGELAAVTASAMRLISLLYSQIYAQDKELAGKFRFLVTAAILSPASGVFKVFDSNT